MPEGTAPTDAGDHGPTAKAQFRVGGMSCSFCVESIQKAYRRMDGVHTASVSMGHEETLVEYDPDRVTSTTSSRPSGTSGTPSGTRTRSRPSRNSKQSWSRPRAASGSQAR